MVRHTDTALLLAVLSLTQAACNTEAYCFDECGDDPSDAGVRDADVPTDVQLDTGSGGTQFNFDANSSGGQGGAVAINDENCNGEDDDGDGQIDEDVDFTSARHCGTCANNCALGEHLINPTCDPPPEDQRDGSTPGTCSYERCETDFYDYDPDVPGCEYYCQWNPSGETDTDLGGVDGCGRDDDCDGDIDEDVNTCDSIENCGRCGKQCVALHGVAECVSTATGNEACTEENTQCQIAECDVEEDGWRWWDVNQSADDGCEYRCQLTNGGVEVCDGLDNDCDKLIDNADPDLVTSDSRIGVGCFGGTEGVCADESHEGVGKCVGGTIRCCDPDSNDLDATNPNFPTNGLRNGICDANTGIQVVRVGELDETCNGQDDDCDGTSDNNLTDVLGQSCGESGTSNCSFGTLHCVDGSPQCVGAINPAPSDECNGQDEDCDGVVDGTAADPNHLVECEDDANCTTPGELCLTASSSSTGRACATPPSGFGGDCTVAPYVVGGTSVCEAGTLQCVNGQPSCENFSGPTSTTDACDEDRNCDGSLDNQPDKQIDPNHCGECGTVCGGGAHEIWTCETGTCVYHECEPGYARCNDNCESPCDPSPSAEVCDGRDNDCDCNVDNGLPEPTAWQYCGFPEAAEATCAVTVTCEGLGGWQCNFGPGYCAGPGCNADHDCDHLDQNCNGIPDDDFRQPNVDGEVLGGNCIDDDACGSPGVWDCAMDGTTLECVVAPSDVITPTDEICDGEDNDCDGYVDEDYRNEGAPGSSYVSPAVVQLGANTWMFAYEASRPGATQFDSASGNGFFTIAPEGETLDQTIACSTQRVLPWTNVTPEEVEQSCDAIGGRVCNVGDWREVCWVGGTNLCAYGYSPFDDPWDADEDGTADERYCDGNPLYPGEDPIANPGGPFFCNLGPYDASSSISGIQSGLLATGSSNWGDDSMLAGCAAEVTTLYSNALDAYDITGNVREITLCQRDRAVCGGPSSSEALCAIHCCSQTSTAVDGPPGAERVCGTLPTNDHRRLPGQHCDVVPTSLANEYRCCNNDECTGEGVCRNVNGYCDMSDGRECLVRGMTCVDDAQCCDQDCLDGVCGGALTLPYSVYPLMGGAFSSLVEAGASCDFDFFKVNSTFKLFDTGFRCCFDSDPR